MKLILSLPGPLRLHVSIALASLLMAMQLATGTELEFAELTFLASFFFLVAVNLVGGLRTLAGWCIAVIALKSFVISQLGKVYFGEPGQSNLDEPLITMGVMAGSMAAICLAAFSCVAFRPTWVVLKPVADTGLLSKMALISLLIGTGSFAAAQFLGVTEEGAVRLGGMAGLLRRISGCAPLAIVAGTAYTIRATQGRRLLGLCNSIPAAVQFGIGVLFTSKQALMEPFLYVALTGVAFGFPWRRLHLLTGISSVFIALFILFPFGQVTRRYTRGANIVETYKKTVDYFDQNLRNPNFLVNQYLDYRDGVEDDKAGRYFNSPNGFLERMSLIKAADMLLSATQKQGRGGWETVTPAFADLLPRLVLPRRYVDTANVLGVRAGMIDEDNVGTAIAFGFAAHAFFAFGWTGMLVTSFLVGVLVIVVTRLLTRDLPGNIWAVVLLGGYQHTVAEGNIGSVLALFTYGLAWVVASLVIVRTLAELWCLGGQAWAWGKSLAKLRTQGDRRGVSLKGRERKRAEMATTIPEF